MHLHQHSPPQHGLHQVLSDAGTTGAAGRGAIQALGDKAKQPYWFHPAHLKSPKKAVHLWAWLVEATYIWPGEHIECVLQTTLHINQWDPEGEAEILIFSRPSYQKDVSNMIMNLTHYHHQLLVEKCCPGGRALELLHCSPVAAIQASPDKLWVAKIQPSHDKVCEAATQRPPILPS